MPGGAEPYYRLTVAQSELEGLLYDEDDLLSRLSAEAASLSSKGESDGVPRLSSISTTHRFPFHLRFSPIVACASQLITHSTATNRRFQLDYGGEYMSRGYQAIDISAGTIAPVVAKVSSCGWAYCKNLLASLIDTISFKVSSDTLFEFTGETFFAYYSLLGYGNKMPALNRMIKESCFELVWSGGFGYTEGDSASQLGVHATFTPPQAYELTHAAMTIYMPLDLISMFSVENAYPIVAVYSLPRWVEYQFKSLQSVINLWAVGVAPAAGFVDPAFTGNALVTWSAVPAITDTRLVIEYWTLNKSLQKILAMSPHGILFRQWTKISDTIVDKNSIELAVTKIIETVYIVSRFYYSVNTSLKIVGGVQQTIALVDLATANQVWEKQPFSLPTDVKPINRVTVAARGQSFFSDLDWDEISGVFPYLYGQPNLTTTYNNCIAFVTMGIWYWSMLHTSSYNNGYGPNLRISWQQNAFSAATSGLIDLIIQSLNMCLFYRGAAVVRYT